MSTQQSWAEEQTRRIAKEIRRLRGERSAQWVANRTADLGHPVSRSTITDLELGRRKYVTTAELMVLARALDTAPMALLYPQPFDEVDMLPDVRATQSFAQHWFAGLVDVPSPDVADDGARYLANLAGLDAARQLWELDGQKVAALKMLTAARGDAAGRAIAFDLLAHLQERIERLTRGND